jgi:hypothetical protein
MAIWWGQFIDGTIRLIDYYENSTFGLGHYADVILSKKYRYAGHHLPHDGTHRQLTMDEKSLSIQNQLARLGLENIDIVPRTTDVYADIQSVRGLLPICRFNYDTMVFQSDAVTRLHFTWSGCISNDSVCVQQSDKAERVQNESLWWLVGLTIKSICI